MRYCAGIHLEGYSETMNLVQRHITRALNCSVGFLTVAVKLYSAPLLLCVLKYAISWLIIYQLIHMLFTYKGKDCVIVVVVLILVTMKITHLCDLEISVVTFLDTFFWYFPGGNEEDHSAGILL
jgi:hypothetical protein